MDNALVENKMRGIVNSYHSRLKKWMNRFNGVVTKYLQHCLDWFRYIDSKE